MVWDLYALERTLCTFRTIFIYIITLCLNAGILMGESQTWKEYKGRTDPVYFPITQIIEGNAPYNLVVISAGSSSGILKGMVLDALRPAPGALLEVQKLKLPSGSQIFESESQKGLNSSDGKKNLWIQTGRVRAIEVQDRFTIAKVEQESSEISQVFFPKFSGIMVGDMVNIPELRIARRPVIVPTLSLSYFELFEDPKARPSTLEISGHGHKALREAVQEFASARLSMLLVEGYTDHQGAAEENQRESYQRALTVRQILIDEYHFDPHKVIAIGYGELEPKDNSFAPGYIERNRRIVLKPIPINENE
jgi:hypothetical protein